MEEFLEKRHYVPNINPYLFEECSNETISTRKKLITKQRAAILISQLKKQISPNDLVPMTDESNTGVSPQQMQFITLLVDFVHQNPQALVNCLVQSYSNSDKTDFSFLCHSVIPAFFGFFSSLEHIKLAFPFYTLLISNAPREICEQALIPFYCNSCTYKFIESIFDRFGYKICTDIRMNNKSISVNVFEEYLTLCINSIVDSYPLLPQQHQFLLKYMKIKGWSKENIFHFFLHSFTLPQLIFYLNSTPYKNYYGLFLNVERNLKPESKYCAPLHNLFKDNSIFEIPPLYSVFGIPYVQLLLSKADVDGIVRSLKSTNSVPPSIKLFVESNYLTSIDKRPFFIKVYSRKPQPVDASYNWRWVVFEDLDVPAIKKGRDKFERIWNQVEIECEDFNVDPIAFLTEEPKTPQEKSVITTINSLLGDEKKDFLQYCASISLKKLNKSSASFENYLVHRLALKTLKKWLNVVSDNLNMMVLPFAEESINENISRVFLGQLVKNPMLIDNLLEVSASKIDMPVIRQCQYMILIQSMLPLILFPNIVSEMRIIEMKWQKHIESIRNDIILPSIFSNRNKNKNQALILNQKLWKIVGLFSSISNIQFSSVFLIFIQAIKQVNELTKACRSQGVMLENKDDALIQFAIAFSDCPVLITRFILINALLVKQERFKRMADSDRYLLLWCKLETAILKILSHKPEFMNSIIKFQNMLIDAKFV